MGYSVRRKMAKLMKNKLVRIVAALAAIVCLGTAAYFTANAMTISSKDRIITLSTCAYDFQNARYVVHGKMNAVK